MKSIINEIRKLSFTIRIIAFFATSLALLYIVFLNGYIYCDYTNGTIHYSDNIIHRSSQILIDILWGFIVALSIPLYGITIINLINVFLDSDSPTIFYDNEKSTK